MKCSKPSTIALAMSILAVAAALVACGGSVDDDDDEDPDPVDVGDTVVLTASGKLMSFDRASPGTVVSSVTLSGLAAGERLIGIDHRPADDKLYGIGSDGNVYTIRVGTGAATREVALRAASGDDNAFTALEGSNFGVDFNPVADRLRVVSDSGQNLRINVDNGDTFTDGTITAQTGSAAVSAAAYTNAFAGTTATQLFVIDGASATLHLQDPPNNGTLGAGRSLGVAAGTVSGFDIDARNNRGYAVLGAGGASTLYSIDLSTGTASSVGAVAGGEAIVALALRQPDSPRAIALTADNQLVAFDPKEPNIVTRTTTISGLASGETVIGVDFRPADRKLYALTSAGRLYKVDPDNGTTIVGPLLAADRADASAPYAGLVGTAFSVDFNPVADRLRVISDTGQNLRINVETGRTVTDGDINRSDVLPIVIAAAYTNSFGSATATALLDVDAASDVLAQQNPPNDGTLANIGTLGIDVAGTAGFDIAGGGNGLVLAALRADGAFTGPFTLYTVSLTTGAASLYRNTSSDASLSVIGGANGPTNLIDLAIRY